MKKHLFSLVGLIGLSIMASCAGGPAAQTPDEWSILKTPLIEGEHIIRANSCGTLKKARLMSGLKSKFGSCFLTNLRFIYEESAWFRALNTASKFIPSGGDFGLTTVVSGTAKALNANMVVGLGQEGKLKISRKEGRVIIPLSDITDIKTVSGYCLTANCDRWIEITVGSGEILVFEIYNFPPDKSGILPASAFISREWKDSIEKARRSAFGF